MSQRKLVGDVSMIFEGTQSGLRKVPISTKRDGFYHLLTAEGGTGWGHAVTMARSQSLLGLMNFTRISTYLPRATGPTLRYNAWDTRI